MNAAADPWGTGDAPDTGEHPDADPHTFCYWTSVGDDAAENMSNAEWNALAPTQADVSFDLSGCDLTGSTETDVVWNVNNGLGEGVFGVTFCDDLTGDLHCDQNYSTLNMTEIEKGTDDEIDETMIACHELGHTAGLTHGGNSTDCMAARFSNDPPTALQYRRYGPHHTDHIDDWF